MDIAKDRLYVSSKSQFRRRSCQFVMSKVGDRIDSLAYKFYGDVTLWWIIAKANGIKGKTALEPGIPLRIPGNITQIIENFINLNTSS